MSSKAERENGKSPFSGPQWNHENLLIYLSELKDLRVMTSTYEDLKKIARDFDPFQPEPTQEVVEILDYYQLSELAKKPFDFTNVLLKALDTLEQRLKQPLQ